MRSGDSRLRTTTTKSDLETTFIVSGSVVLWTSTSELRKYRGSHSGDSRFRTTTTKSGLETTFIVSGSVVLWTSMSELRKYRGSHSYKY
ncbi:hypothetical protein V1477_016225 [Vespula maculifrons]|uniref:Uncharacterized protein n=1 Tax=Vespula maculifrons TaxID=7453 RepID=A0ABD2BCF0_VESMC